MSLLFHTDWPKLPLRGIDVLAVVLSVVLALIVSVAVVYLVRPPGGLHVAYLLFYGTIAGVIFLVPIARRGATWADLGLRPSNLTWGAIAVAMAGLTYLLVWPVELAMDAIAGGDYQNPEFQAHLEAVPSWPWWIPEVILSVGVGPLVEELFFRGVLYGWLRQRTRPLVALLGSSLLFALYHGIPLMIPVFFVAGMVFALVYERSRSLWPAIITHGAYNALVLISWHSL